MSPKTCNLFVIYTTENSSGINSSELAEKSVVKQNIAHLIILFYYFLNSLGTFLVNFEA